MENWLIKEVERRLVECGVTPGTKVVAGVSGGPDSLALMHILNQIIQTGNLIVGHLNHLLREEADEEARFVSQTAESWGIPFTVDQIDVQLLAKSEGMSVEEAARNARYNFLLRLAKSEGAQYILVGHHADDQVETVFLNLLRGSGLTGLKGMELARSFAGENDILLVRPFLYTWREAILTYCEEHGLKPMIDSSNKDVTYRRNLIRHEILPRLAQINPGFKQHMQQMSQLVKADEAYLFQQTKKALEDITLAKKDKELRLNRAKWLALPLSLQRRTLRLAVLDFQTPEKDISFGTIEQAWHVAETGSAGAKSDLPGDLTLEIGYRDMVLKIGFGAETKTYPQLNSAKILKLPVPGTVKLNDEWRITAQFVEKRLEEIRENNDPWQAFIASETVGHLFIRTRQPGERFQPLGMDGRSTSIQDFMVNEKLPEKYRDGWPIVATDDHPVWIVGHRIDDRVKVSEQGTAIHLLVSRKINQ